MNKQRMIVEWSPHDPSLFAVGADNLRLYESTSTDVDGNISTPTGSGRHDPRGAAAAITTQRKRSFRLIKINSQMNAQNNTQLKCMEWYPFDAKPLWIASGMGNGKVVLSDFQDPRSRIVREFAPKYTRPCNAVAWNHAAPNQLAAGFEKVRSDYCTLVWDLNMASSGSTIMGSGRLSQSDSGAGMGLAGALVGTHLDALGHDELGVSILGGSNSVMAGSMGAGIGSGLAMGNGNSSSGGMRSGGFPRGGSSGGLAGTYGSGGGGDSLHDRPVHELSNSEATVALSWVPLQPACLAVGTGFKWLRIYDLRATMNGTAPLSVVAHNKAVLGVVFDRHRPHILATYTDSPQEAIKIWDIRRLDTNLGPLVSLHHASKTLAQVTWCPTKPGILATASVEERYVSLWDVNKQDMVGPNGAMQIKKPFKRRYTSEPLTSFSWQYVQRPSSVIQRKRGDKNGAMNARLAAAAFPNRLLTASISGEIEDISVHNSLPLSVSPTGSLAFSCGLLLFGGSTTTGDGTTTSLTSPPNGSGDDEDIAVEMQRLAKSRYSMVVEKNLRLFAMAYPTPRQRQLRSLWRWVDQVEALRRIQVARIAHSRAINSSGSGGGVGPTSPLRGWPVDAATLTMVGVKHLLGLSEDGTSEPLAPSKSSPLTTIPSSLKTDAALGCSYYEGFGRRLALLACHWDPDCGQASAAAAAMVDQLPPRQNTALLHRSSSGAWTSQRQFEADSSHSSTLITSFGNRSSTENARHELRQILAKCESDGNYSRGAALAVFHGDLAAAVAILQKGAMYLSQMQNLTTAIHAPYSSDVLQLVAMAVAGFSTVANAATGGASMWASMCQQLLKREEITAQHHPRYLHALLSFLCAASMPSSGSSSSGSSYRGNIPPQQQQQPRRGGGGGGSNNPRKPWGSADGLSVMTNSNTNPTTRAASMGSGNYSVILYDATLPLSDRIAFACRFLPPEELRIYVAQCEQECHLLGRLDGVLLTGLGSHGVQLLQKYLDKTGDIQTLALLAARLPAVHLAKHAPVLENWIVIYQDLLNQWQLFHERARFDVARSQHEDVLNGFANFAKDPDAEELHHELNAPQTLTVPPQLYVRCNFCNHSLSLANLLRLGGSHSSWLNRAKPKLSCCPSCRKPLPQCALCLLPLGALNPYLELAHRRSKQTAEAVASIVSLTGALGDAGGGGGGGGGSLMVVEDPLVVGGVKENANESLAQLSSIPFVEWFTWCQTCKHGGHAHHIADWFASHIVCPVTDCGCQCQHVDLPIALQKRQEEGRLLQEEQQEEQQQQQQQQEEEDKQRQQQQLDEDGLDIAELDQHRGGGVNGSSPLVAAGATPPRLSPSVSPGGTPGSVMGSSSHRRGSRSQQQQQQQQAQMMMGMAMGQATPRAGAMLLPPQRAMTPLMTSINAPTTGASGGGGDLVRGAMNSMSLSSKLDQLDKEKGGGFFL